MKRFFTTIILLTALYLFNTSFSYAGEFSGYIAPEIRIFPSAPLYPGQKKNDISIAVQPEFYHEWESGSSFIFVPFGRLDSADSRRTHFDIRELNYLWLNESWELRIGVGKVFWGVTEFVHLIDIINQIDYVESIDGEERLGQPMVQLSIPRDWGVFEFFVLPYFRERTFPGRHGRLRPPLVVDTDNPQYESSQKEYHLDFAVRYSHTLGNWDFGIYHFYGTGREPALLPGIDGEGEQIFIPYYEIINQTGIDVLLVVGKWLFKLESFYRTGQEKDFFAAVGGFEYTFVGIAGTGMDLGIIVQLAYDDRHDEITTPFENDAIFGVRLTVNDAAGTQILAGILHDIDNSAKAIKVEASRRFGQNWKASLQGWIFFDAPEDDPFYGFRDDDFLQLQLFYYF